MGVLCVIVEAGFVISHHNQHDFFRVFHFLPLPLQKDMDALRRIFLVFTLERGTMPNTFLIRSVLARTTTLRSVLSRGGQVLHRLHDPR